MSEYSEKLKDPRWQRKRLEVFNRDEFKCRVCHDTSQTLHCHHRYYVPGREPWEYPSVCYLTVCKPCHDGMKVDSSCDPWEQAMDSVQNMERTSLGFQLLYGYDGDIYELLEAHGIPIPK